MPLFLSMCVVLLTVSPAVMAQDNGRAINRVIAGVVPEPNETKELGAIAIDARGAVDVFILR